MADGSLFQPVGIRVPAPRSLPSILLPFPGCLQRTEAARDFIFVVSHGHAYFLSYFFLVFNTVRLGRLKSLLYPSGKS